MQTENLTISSIPPGTPPAKKVKTKYPKIFQCTGYGDCKMTFTRSEHLARHIRKHTGERPFSCHCSRSFSRLDNLRQHIQTVHANEQHIMHSTTTQSQANQQVHHVQQNPQQIPPAIHHNNLYNKPLPQPIINGDQKPDPHAMMVDSPPPEPSPSFRSKNRPSPINLDNNSNNTHMNGVSPTSPMFQHSNGGAGPGYYGGNGYPPPTTPTSNGVEPTTPTTPYNHGYASSQQHFAPNMNGNFNGSSNGYQYANNSNYENNASNGLRSYRSVAQLSTTSTASTISRQPSISSFSSPMYSQSSKTSSWLSNVLCDPQDPNSYPHGHNHHHHPEEERPHTWGPSTNHNRFSSATDDGDVSVSDRNSLSQLVRITEDAHISSPPPTSGESSIHSIHENGQLPSLSTIFHQPLRQSSVSASPSSATSSSSFVNTSTSSFGDTNRPQLSATRSYTKNLILPRPESYPPPKGYVMTLPIADTRPPTVPPAGSEGITASSTTRPSGSITRFNSSLTKPLPPLPMEAQQQHGHSSSGQPNTSEGMDVLMQAAGV